jgi:eukaryotic-like serine/threonine-protein kinase
VTAPTVTAARLLSGLKLPDGWTVLNEIEQTAGHTGGTYSVCYLARRSDGLMGFLKALDYAEALDSDEPARALEDLTTLYNAEVDLLAFCGQRRLHRVVRVLAADSIRVEGVVPPVVNYLILELADGDTRDLVGEVDSTDHVTRLRVAHHAAVAMQQLHSVGAAHQDVKPSNFLFWRATDGDSDYEGKLGDLGCAFVDGGSSPIGDLVVPGDPRYAPPEQLYRRTTFLASRDLRRSADLYMLGNLLCFLLTGVSYNALLYGHLDPSQHWDGWSGDFEGVLPGLIDAHGQALGRVRSALPSAFADDIASALNDLCNPDVVQRGNRTARRRGSNQYQMERFVSLFNLLHRKAVIAASNY